MTEEELKDLTKPVRTFDDWRLRVMIRECERRRAVMRGLVDSLPNEPWRVCDPMELKAWTKAHALTETQVNKQHRAGDARNNYGVTGKAR